MAIYVIGDLHLSFSDDKPMEVFGEQWRSHYEKIEADWKSKVREEDLVILLGDTSWAISLENAKKDLEWIDKLPGKKLFLKGNHDYWWTSVSKMKAMFPAFHFLHNAGFVYDGVALFGSRGWSPYEEREVANAKIIEREVGRLERSYSEAKQRFEESMGSAEQEAFSPICLMHYPPYAVPEFHSKLQSWGIREVYYGHLHGEQTFKHAVNGNYEGVGYHLVSCDYLDFKLLRIRE